MCSAIFGFMMSTNGRILTKSLSVLSMLGSIKHLDICLKKNSFWFYYKSIKIPKPYVKCDNVIVSNKGKLSSTPVTRRNVKQISW